MDTILFLAHTEADGTLAKPALEALGAAVDLKQSLGAALIVGLYGAQAQPAANSLANCGADKFLAIQGEAFAPARYASDAAACEALARASAATIILAAETSRSARVMAGVAHRLGGVEVQLDLDAVGIVHEELVERLAVGAPLAELDLVLAQVSHGLREAPRAERDVIDCSGSRARVLREPSQVGPLVVARVPRAPADVHDVLPLEIHPVDGKAEVRVPALLHAEDVAVPVARALHVVGGDEVVLDVGKRHGAQSSNGQSSTV